MKTFLLKIKNGKDVVNTYTCDYLSEAIDYFCSIKKLSPSDLLTIFDVTHKKY